MIKSGETAIALFVNDKSGSDKPIDPEQPDKPTDPDQPIDPEQPDKPTDPEEPGIPGETEQTSAPEDNVAKTGDASNPLLWLVLIGISCAAIISVVVITRKHRKNLK